MAHILNCLGSVETSNYLFSLLCTYQKRHEYLRCIERDYENGCFGTGEAERLLIGLVEQDIERLNNMTTYMCTVLYCTKIRYSTVHRAGGVLSYHKNNNNIILIIIILILHIVIQGSKAALQTR